MNYKKTPLYTHSRVKARDNVTAVHGDIEILRGDDIRYNNAAFNLMTLNSNMSVGVPDQGATSFLGEGAPYAGSVLTSANLEAGPFTDNTAAAASAADSSFVPLVASGNTNCFFVGGDRPFFGLQLDILVAPGGFAVVYEYWDGAVWTAFNHMDTQGVSPYVSYADQGIFNTGLVNVRFAELPGWAPVAVGGAAKYWMRVRSQGPVGGSLPTLESILLIGSSVKLNEDGFIEYFGGSQPRSVLPWHYGLVQVVNLGGGTPGNQDIFAGSAPNTVGLGMIENNFNADNRGVGFVSTVPFDIDTSYPICMRFYVAYSANDASTIDFDINWKVIVPAPFAANSPVTENAIGTNAGNALSTGGTASFQLTYNAEIRVVKVGEVFIDIPYAVSRRAAMGAGDLLFVSIIRRGVTGAGSVYGIHLSGEYRKWNEGAK